MRDDQSIRLRKVESSAATDRRDTIDRNNDAKVIEDSLKGERGKTRTRKRTKKKGRSLFGPSIVVFSMVLMYVGLFQWERVEEIVQKLQNTIDETNASTTGAGNTTEGIAAEKFTQKKVAKAPCPLGFGDLEEDVNLGEMSCLQLYENEKYDKSMSCYQSQLEELITKHGNQTAHPDVAQTIEKQAEVLSAMHNQNAIMLYRAAISMRGQLSDNYTDTKALYYSDQVIRGLFAKLAAEQMYHQDLNGAQESLQQLVAMLEDATNSSQHFKHLDLAEAKSEHDEMEQNLKTAWNNLATVSYRKQDFGVAVESFQRVLERMPRIVPNVDRTTEELKELKQRGTILMAIAGAHQHMDAYDAAYKAYNEISAMWTQIQMGEERLKHDIGGRSKPSTEKTEHTEYTIFQRAVALAEVQLVVAQALADQGAALQTQSKQQEAIASYQQSFTAFDAWIGRAVELNTPQQQVSRTKLLRTNTLFNYGLLNRDLGNIEKARDAFELVVIYMGELLESLAEKHPLMVRSRAELEKLRQK